MRQLVEEIERICREYRACCVEVESWAEGVRLRRELEAMCRDARGMMEICRSELLMALLDAYEITRDEGMLQEVLDMVSGNMERLEVSVEAVRLLAYCYYYVEEEECAAKAREMLERLRKEGKDVGEVEKVLEEML